MNNEKHKGKFIVERILDEEKSLSGEEFNNWVNSEEGNRKDFDVYQKIWNVSKKAANIKAYNTTEGWEVVDPKIQKGKIRKLQLSKLIYAATGVAASLIILFGMNLLLNDSGMSDHSLVVTTKYGNRSDITLPDGSVVRLNAGTNIKYFFDRKNETRNVRFSGEGYFKVAKNNIPFVVQTSDGLKVKVLGTEFNLSAYEDDAEVFTTLLEGSVELSNKNGEKLLMVPGQIASYAKESDVLNLVDGDPKHTYGWLDDKIYLDNTTLTETARLLERRYGVEITMQPARLGDDISYTGVLEEKSVIDVLEALKHLSGVEYRISGKEVIITNK